MALDASLTGQLRSLFGNLIGPVQLREASDGSPKGRRMAELLAEIAAQSDLVTVVEDGSADLRRPSFLVATPGADTGVRFAGVPLGHELTSLVLAILQVGGHPSKEPPALQERARRLAPAEPLRFETFFSLSCQNCPIVVQALNLISILNPRVSHTAIEGSAFQDEADARGVMAVPTIFVNGREFGQGRMTLTRILDRIIEMGLAVDPEAAGSPGAASPSSPIDEAGAGLPDRSAGAAPPAEPTGPASGSRHDVLVIGGGPAGTTAAIYTARKGLDTALVAERMGGQVLDTASIENLPSQIRVEGPEYGRQLENHVRAYPVEVLADRRAVSLEAGAPDGGGSATAASVRLDDGSVVSARTVILATGAHWRQLGVPGEDEYRNRGVTSCPHCDGPLFAGKRVAVIGGGNSGIEAAIDLAGVAAHVDVVEFDTRLRADEVLLRTLRTLGNVDVHVNAATREIVGDGRSVTGLRWTDRESGAETTLPVDGVFVQIGLIPNTGWLRGAVDLNARGEIVVDASLATSVPGVFAAGDCTTSRDKQVVVAAGEGAQAALSAFDQMIRAVV
ncbi:alkyl hydroperoxide reductase subunit F [Schaalia naturae]|uniref:Alkyl hydroperoxide reductase subunit F n=2 Tax=Schaalia naturae TaxID=635203 RepID=A0ABW2SMN4_9ACTO